MIKVENINKNFDGKTVLKNVSFSLPPNTILSVLGKSGCGKTTLLKILAGLLQPDSGVFEVYNQNVFSIAQQQRGVVYLSQEPLLFSHLNVFENIAYGLRIRKTEKSIVKLQVEELAHKLKLQDQLNKNTEQLSGGQKHRVSFGRALIINPKIMLLDEPFGSLDAHTRVEMQELFQQVKHSVKMAALFVTHDLKEALLMGNQIAVMDEGHLLQYESMQDFAQSHITQIKSETEFWKNILNDDVSVPTLKIKK